MRRKYRPKFKWAPVFQQGIPTLLLMPVVCIAAFPCIPDGQIAAVGVYVLCSLVVAGASFLLGRWMQRRSDRMERGREWRHKVAQERAGLR